MTSDRQMTHWPGCEVEHSACAARVIGELRAELRAIGDFADGVRGSAHRRDVFVSYAHLVEALRHIARRARVAGGPEGEDGHD